METGRNAGSRGTQANTSWSWRLVAFGGPSSRYGVEIFRVVVPRPFWHKARNSKYFIASGYLPPQSNARGGESGKQFGTFATVMNCF